MDSLTQRQRKLLRWGALKNERSTWISRYKEISDYLLPFSGRFFSQDRNRGDKSFNSILDSTATDALDTLKAGMMAGMTSPARPWFRLAVTDDDIMEVDSVKRWLNAVEKLMREIFHRSNTYRALDSMYEELGGFATAVDIIDDNYDKVIWHNPLTVGEYAIAVDPLGRVNTIAREFEMTVAQIVEQFAKRNPKSGSYDFSNISPAVKNMWDNGRGYDQWVPVLHVIEPRSMYDRDASKRDARNMPWASCYYEMAGVDDIALRESGYKEFPGLAARWHTRGRDIYGNGPSMKALGDIKQLQHEQLRKGQGIDYMTMPPVALPGELKGREIDTLPGGVNFLGMTGGMQGRGGHNLFDVKISLEHLLTDIQDVRQRIYRAFYADLFRMLIDDPRREPVTAREIAERHEEKLLMLGPVLERLHDEMLSPLIDVTFSKMVENRLLPPPPQELEGTELKVEFVSMLAQAQKAVGLQSVDRLIGTVAAIATGSQDPSVWDKVNKDEIVDKYADMLAIDPSLIVSDDQVVIVRKQRAQALQAQAMAQAAPQMTQAAKNLSETNTEDKNALTDITRPFQGYS